MNRVLSLIRVLMQNAEMKIPKEGKNAKIYMTIGIVAVCGIMIPCCIVCGIISYTMTEALAVAGAPQNGLLAEVHIMSAFSLVFGLMVIFNILFFSSDREHLVPLPFRSSEILLAKFLYAYMAESLMEFMILIAMYIGYYFSQGVTPINLISGVIGVLLIPLVPMAYCAIIGLILLTVFRNVKNSKFFGHISTVSLVLFIALFLFSLRDMGTINVENYVASLAGDTNLFNKVLNKLFFTVPLLCDATQNGDILKLLLFVLGNVAVVGFMVLLGHLTYQNALYTIGSLGSGKSSADRNISAKSNSPFMSYLKKEFRVLFRTRAYSGNCVFINYLWPAVLVGFIILNKDKASFAVVKGAFAMESTRAFTLMTIAVVALSFIASAMNSLASTAFTREGMHLDLIKYIPVSYKTQMWAKAVVSLIITFPALLICVIVSAVTFKISILWVIYYIFVIVFSLLFTTFTGMYLDSSHPHSTWDDEYSALRGNLNTFFDMAIVLVLAVVICGIGFLVFQFAPLGIIEALVVFHVYIFVVTAAMGIYCFTVFPKKIIENMKKM